MIFFKKIFSVFFLIFSKLLKIYEFFENTPYIAIFFIDLKKERYQTANK